ncbi:fatty-acyl-CoA synthase [Mycobacterium xenopi]|uniref:Long-chain-fatty-acid--CoA ligase FadD13 n=2 Tax=Mycobacterium xenopi TaxID=1789 RepID=A0AAD1H0B2_MYCXE|nr:fatty-acyl-CoA synthase [Mycobacterium xenopi]
MGDPFSSMTVGDIVADNANRFPDVAAYRQGEQMLTHRDLRERALRMVSAMMATGVRPQDRVAILARNSIEFGEVLAATQLSGVILAAINFRLSPSEVLDAFRRVTPSIVFCDAEFAPLIGDLAPQVPGLKQLVSLGDAGQPGMPCLEEFVAEGVPGEPPLVARPEDIACLLFTSGTTGASKCCIIGQRELREVALTMNTELRSGSDDRALINMPMFHIGAIAIIGGVHARGGTVVLQKQFEPAETVRLAAAERVTVLHLAPVMLKALLDEIDEDHRLNSVHTVVYAAAPMSMIILRQALSKLPGAGFLNLYGQTEAIVSGLPRELHRVDRPDAADQLRSVGFPFPGVAVRIVDDDGHDMPAGEAGEIVVRSNSLFRGYWDDHAATLATLRNGWCHTGDIGRLDDRGLLYLVDRKKDVIITGGENVYSPEVEDVVSGVPGVLACAVVGAPDERWGEAVCAVVVPRPDQTPTLAAVQEYGREKLAGYKVPRRLVIVDELPMLASGKVDKKRLRADIAKGAD